jgi:hypothetical protein
VDKLIVTQPLSRFPVLHGARPFPCSQEQAISPQHMSNECTPHSQTHRIHELGHWWPVPPSLRVCCSLHFSGGCPMLSFLEGGLYVTTFLGTLSSHTFP